MTIMWSKSASQLNVAGGKGISSDFNHQDLYRNNLIPTSRQMPSYNQAFFYWSVNFKKPFLSRSLTRSSPLSRCVKWLNQLIWNVGCRKPPPNICTVKFFLVYLFCDILWTKWVVSEQNMIILLIFVSLRCLTLSGIRQLYWITSK